MTEKIVHDLEFDYIHDTKGRNCLRFICHTCKKTIVKKHFEYVGDGISAEWYQIKFDFETLHPNYKFWSEFNK